MNGPQNKSVYSLVRYKRNLLFSSMWAVRQDYEQDRAGARKPLKTHFRDINSVSKETHSRRMHFFLGEECR